MAEPLFTRCQQALAGYWGYEAFRPGQDKAIRSVLEGRDTLVLFPTGGGKSLCYQVPAMVLEGLTLVISPLVALMQDQVEQLRGLDIPATFINSSLSGREIDQRLLNARNGMYKLLYCAPERLKTPAWQHELEQLDISLVAIDEAHCISEWGHDFRPDYRDIRPSLEPVAARVRWVALTATATPEVREDIIENLAFENPAIISKGFERPNLKWWVVETNKKDEKLLQSVKKASQKGSGLVYGGTRRNCERIAEMVAGRVGLRAAAYHAGVEPVERQRIQSEWIEGALPLVVATNAFGMGIDKADCRYVIHYEMTHSLEAYYQQAGRAGRDGEESYPVLLFKESDLRIAEKRISDSYPGKADLERVYNALCDALELAVGAEMEERAPVSVEALKKRSKKPAITVWSALRVLDQLGVIELTEESVPMVRLQFLSGEELLLDKIQRYENTRKAVFLDNLMRQYGRRAFGSFESVELNYLRHKLDVSHNGLIKGLEILQNHDRVLRYEIAGGEPEVRLREARVKRLPFSKKELEKHRNALLGKLDWMKGYIRTENCREVYIRAYFGEKHPAPCGHCDNCLKESDGANRGINRKELIVLKELLTEEGRSFNEIRKETRWGREQVKQLLSHLLREQKVAYKADKYYWAPANADTRTNTKNT